MSGAQRFLPGRQAVRHVRRVPRRGRHRADLPGRTDRQRRGCQVPQPVRIPRRQRLWSQDPSSSVVSIFNFFFLKLIHLKLI